MPIKINVPDPTKPVYEDPLAPMGNGYIPNGPFQVLIAEEQYDVIPPDFESLPPEEQERIKTRIRYRGIRCRHDIDTQVPVSRRTLEL